MKRLLKTIFLVCILGISNALTIAQGECELEVIESADVTNQGILFVVSTDNEQQIWQYDFLEDMPVNTGFGVPVDASPLVLGPNGKRLAHMLRDYNGDILLLKVFVLNIETGVEYEVFSGMSPEITQVVGLHWLDEQHLGFVSNGKEQQYTIIDIEHNSFETYYAGIPIPERNTIGESIWGDWDVEFSPNFSYAAFLNLRDYTTSITFWDLSLGQRIESDIELPVRWVAGNKAFTWIDEYHFLILNDELNWLEYSILEDSLRQITDVGDKHMLRGPIVAPDMTSIAFQVWDTDMSNVNASIGGWRNGELIEGCLEREIGSYRMNANGWDVNSRYFAFTVDNYGNPDTQIYLFDSETSVIYSLEITDPKAVVLGWTEVI